MGELDADALCQPWDGRLSVEFGDGQTDVAPTAGYRSPPMKRIARDLRAVNEHALTHLCELPGPGEAYHFLLGDRLGLWDTIPAMLRRIEPATIRQLHVSTLSFGSTTPAELLSLVDARKIGRVTFLVSVMLAAKNRHVRVPPDPEN